MPAKSKAQQKFMGMVHAAQKGEKAASAKVAKVAKRMKKKDAEDYASTKHKGLPNKVKKEALLRLIAKYGAEKVKETIMAVSPKSDKGYREPEKPDFEYDPDGVDEGFGGELKGKDKDEFEKARKENAEVLGYEATGTSDTKKQTLKMAHQLKEAKFTDDTLVPRLKHWSKQHKGTGIGYGHVLGQLAVHMKEMGWNKSYKEIARIAVELGKKKTVESVNEGKWSKIMTSVRKGSKAGPWSIVAYKNKKVLHQRLVKILQQIPAHYEEVKKKYPRAKIGIEDKYGERVYTESVNESGILYRAGVKKYGKEGMKKIQQAAGKRKSHAEIGAIKDKYEKDKKESVNEGGMGILDKDQTDVLHGIVMKNKSKNSKVILSIVIKDKMFKGVDKKELLGYIEGAKQFVKYMKSESVNEYDLGLTYKKGKTVKVKHKSSGKRLVIVDKPAVRKEYEKIGFYAESVNEAAKRDYKDEYKKFQSSTKSKKYRAELNQYNRKKGTYGNNDGKDASHKGGKIAGFEKESTNRGRAEKSRLKREVSNPTSGIMMAGRMGVGNKYSSKEAQIHVDKDLGTMSKHLGKASQQVIKIMMDGVKGGKYDAMDLQRGFKYGPVKRTHFGEIDFIKQLWHKVREKFRKYSKRGKLK